MSKELIPRHAILDPAFEHTLFYSQDEAIRQLIANIEGFPEYAGSEDPSDRYLVNYVTALLGERGAGKTTVMLELRKRLKSISVEKNWITTEILVPDVLQSRESIGPAIFDVVSAALLRNADDEPTREYINSVLSPLRANLAWFDNPFVPNDIIARDSISTSSFARGTFDYHINAKNLHTQFSNAVESCVDQMNLNKIIVLIDDADINIKLVGRVLDVIRYALSSPRIVTVFSCDYYTLRRRLFNEQLETLNIEKLPDQEGFSLFGGSGEAFKAREVEAEREYVDAYLTKLMPPSTRVTLHSVPAEKVLRHKIKVGSNGDSNTVADFLDTIILEDARTKASVKLSSIVEKYPHVIETNLRGFVNQASELALIRENYLKKNNYYFDLIDAGAKNVSLVGEGVVRLTGSISPLDEAALIKVLQVFLSSPVHADWLEGWAYFGILDVPSERSISRMISTIISRMSNTGSVIDILTFSVTGAENRTIPLNKRSEVHVIHLIIDLAVVFGADIDSIYRLIRGSYTNAFRHYFLSQQMLEFFKSHKSEISNNITIIDGSDISMVAGLLTAQRDNQSISPLFVRSAKDMASHMHRAMHAQTFMRVKETNDAFQQVLKDENVTPAIQLRAEESQFYKIIYYLMDLCVDQIESAYASVFEYPATEMACPEFVYTTAKEANWGIFSPLDGWSFMFRLLSQRHEAGNCSWEKPLVVLFQIAQLPYELMFACFRTSPSELECRSKARALAVELKEFLVERGFVQQDNTWLFDEEFRMRVKEFPDLSYLHMILTYWPSVNMWERGQSLLNLLEFLMKDGIDLPQETKLQASPPPIWKAWVDEFLAAERDRIDLENGKAEGDGKQAGGDG